MDMTGMREITEDNVTVQDLFTTLSKMILRVSRLEVIAVDLISVVMGADDLKEEDADYIAKVAARFVSEIADERKVYEEMSIAALFLESPE